jgi:AraC-like DNA-binding protein
MTGYRERPARTPGAVVWTRDRVADAPTRVLPDGCMDLIWTGEQVIVAGPDTRAQLVSDGDPTLPPYVGLRFAPGVAPAVLGVPASTLRDRRVPLAQIWPQARVRRLTERLAEASLPSSGLGAAAAGRVLEELAVPGDPFVRGVAALLGTGAPVAEVARRVGLSERQLRRRSLDAFGYGPKTLARVLRMRRALALTDAGLPAAIVAARAGYADQPHMIRELRSLTAVSASA